MSYHSLPYRLLCCSNLGGKFLSAPKRKNQTGLILNKSLLTESFIVAINIYQRSSAWNLNFSERLRVANSNPYVAREFEVIRCHSLFIASFVHR